jgi:hypothetical protein
LLVLLLLVPVLLLVLRLHLLLRPFPLPFVLYCLPSRAASDCCALPVPVPLCAYILFSAAS